MANKNKNNYLWIGIAVVAVVILAIVLISNSNNNSRDEVTCNSPYILVGTECCLDENYNSICDSDETTKEQSIVYASTNDLEGELKWVELMDIVGDVPRCSNGKNEGDIWLDFSIKNVQNIQYSCETDLIEGENSYLWSGENSGKWGDSISGKVAFGQYLKEQHTIKVCCSPSDKTNNVICKSFTLDPYC